MPLHFWLTLQKICDFGLAARLDSPDQERHTMCGTYVPSVTATLCKFVCLFVDFIVGFVNFVLIRPNYISPEIVARTPHGLAADRWALGCLLYTYAINCISLLFPLALVIDLALSVFLSTSGYW